MALDVGVEERIRQCMEEVRVRAKLADNFLRPIETQIGRWAISLSYGSAAQMTRLADVEKQAREAKKMPPRAPTKPGACWHLAAKMVDRVGVEAIDFEELGMIAKAAGASESTLLTPIETMRKGVDILHWQWFE